MTEHSPITPSGPLDRRAARRQRRADRSRGGGAWVAGTILIVLGGIFLLQNAGIAIVPFRNWWALFILIPAIAAFGNALRAYRDAGNQLDRPARSSLLVGIALTFVTGMFLFGISWSFFGPVLIILLGIALIINYTMP
jgi:hypothetical protein